MQKRKAGKDDSMTIDTSREAVERLLDGVTGDLSQGFLLDTAETRRWSQGEREKANASEKCNVFSGFRVDDAGRSRQHVASFHRSEDAAFFARAPGMLTALLAERDAALAEVARLSTPPDDAEVRAWALALDETARGHDDEYEGTGYAIYQRLADEAREVSGFLTRLSHALAAERKLADDAKRLLEMAQDRCGHNFVGAEYPTFVDFCDAHAARREAETPAKHGSKT